MIRSIKILGLLVGAIMAMSAMAASVASAVEFHSDSTGSTVLTNTTTTGTSHKFDAAGNTITCTTAVFTGTQTAKTASAINITASYSNCTFFGVPVTVSMGNCEYEFKANGEVGIVSQSGKACNSAKITFKATFLGVSCHVEIGEQFGLKSVTYDGSTTAGASVTVTPAVTGITYTATGSGCGEVGINLKNGNYTSGTTTMTGYTDNSGAEGASTPIWVA